MYAEQGYPNRIRISLPRYVSMVWNSDTREACLKTMSEDALFKQIASYPELLFPYWDLFELSELIQMNEKKARHFLRIIEDKCKLHMDNEPDNWYYLLVSKGRFEKRFKNDNVAIICFREALEFCERIGKPNWFTSGNRNEYASVLLQSGKIEDAIEILANMTLKYDYEKMVSPGDILATHELLGDAFLKDMKWKEALSSYRFLLELLKKIEANRDRIESARRKIEFTENEMKKCLIG